MLNTPPTLGNVTPSDKIKHIKSKQIKSDESVGDVYWRVVNNEGVKKMDKVKKIIKQDLQALRK